MQVFGEEKIGTVVGEVRLGFPEASVNGMSVYNGDSSSWFISFREPSSIRLLKLIELSIWHLIIKSTKVILLSSSKMSLLKRQDTKPWIINDDSGKSRHKGLNIVEILDVGMFEAAN